jgi:hypothetical protein
MGFLHFVSPDFFQVFITAGIASIELIPNRMLFVVILMVILSPVKCRNRSDFRNDGLIVSGRPFEFIPGLFSQPLLLLRMIKDRRPVLRASVNELASGIRGIDLPPEYIEKWPPSRRRGLQRGAPYTRSSLRQRWLSQGLTLQMNPTAWQFPKILPEMTL